MHCTTASPPRRPSSSDPGLTIADFMRRPSFGFMHHLPHHPKIHHALRQVFGARSNYRYCSHNEIGINRIVNWHKDRLNDQYRKYQKLPLAGPPHHFRVLTDQLLGYVWPKSAPENRNMSRVLKISLGG